MPRPKLCRKIIGSPSALFFSPAPDNDEVANVATITLEEFEAIRLGDWLGLYHDECARQMEVSRQTFGNMITVARQKIAGAIVNGQAIRIAGENNDCCHKKSSVCGKCSRQEGGCCRKKQDESTCCGKRQKKCCKSIFKDEKENKNEDMPTS